MVGSFELFRDEELSFAFRLKAADGTVLAISGQFPDKASAVEGIRAVRECAGMGLITDLCPPGFNDGAARGPSQSSDPSADEGHGYLRSEEIPSPAAADRAQAA